MRTRLKRATGRVSDTNHPLLISGFSFHNNNKKISMVLKLNILQMKRKKFFFHTQIMLGNKPDVCGGHFKLRGWSFG